MVIDKRALVIPNNVKNSTYIINNNLPRHHTRLSESKDLAQFTLNIDLTRHNFDQAEAPSDDDFLKKGVQYPKLLSNPSHQMVTCICTNRESMMIYAAEI